MQGMDWVANVLTGANDTAGWNLVQSWGGIAIALIAIAILIYRERLNRRRIRTLLDDAQAAKRAFENEARLNTLVNNLPFSCWICDAEGRHLLQNAVDAQRWGNLIGLRYEDSDLPASIVSEWIPYRQQVLAGEVVQAETHHKIDEIQQTFFTILAPTRRDGVVQGYVGVSIDITEQKKAEAALRQSEIQHRAVLNAIPDLMIRLHRDGTILDYKPSPDFKAYLTQAAIGKSLYEVFPPNLAQERMMYIERALQTETTQVYELQLPIEGKIRTHEARIVVCGEDEVVAIVRDVSERARLDAERQRAELALQESRDLFSATFNESTDAIFVVDGQTGLILDCNQRSLELFEADHKEELLGKQGTSFHKTPWTPEIMAAVNQELQANGVWNSEIEYCTCKDNVFWGSISNKLFSIANKSLIWVRITDISDRKQAERALQQKEQFLQLVLDNIPEQIFWKDRESTYLGGNQLWAEMVGLDSTEDVVGKTDYDLPWNPGFADDYRQEDRTIIETEQPVIQAVEYKQHANGQWLWTRVNKVPIPDEQGNVIGILGTIEDITASKLAEESLRSRNQELLTLHNISEITLRSQSLKAAFQGIVEEISSATGFPIVAIELYDPIRQLMVFEGMQGIALPPGCDRLEVPIDQTLSGQVALTGQAVIRHLVQQEAKLCGANDILKRLGIQTFICLPMTVNQKTIGALSLGHPEDVPTDERSLQWLSSLANYLALISDRKQAEISLRESEGRLKLALDATQMGIWELDLLTKQSTWSESCEVLYGLAPGSFEGTQAAFLRQVHPDDLEFVQQYLAQVTQQDTELSHEFRIVHPDGSVHWVLERGQIFYDEDGSAVRILGISIDITDRKQFEAFLQQANEELDIKVAERTAELNHAIAQLQQEILQRQQTEAALQDAHAKLTQWVDDLEQRHQEITLLNEMSDLMQACLTVDEAYIVIAQLMPHLFPGCGGAVYAISESKQLVEAATIWGEQADGDGEAAIASQFLFTSDQCLALRRGQPHYVEDTHRGLCCPHLLAPLPQSYFCVPMVAQGTASGVLYISSPDQPLTQAKQQLATTVARQVALAIANLKLYATLQNQSTRDPLTGLFNRRYLGEFLERELRRAERNQHPLSVLLLDVDHFKQFNDTYGHDAGDAVLRHLSQFLQAQVRGSDIACRYGGEEMVLILPEVSLDIAHQRAEQIRQGVKHLAIEYQQQLGSITVSVGIACFPDHGSTSELLLQSADLALYQAKAAGRDRVVAVS
ncbi:MAG: diguanylate cyclase [Thainema sp.]